MRLESLSKKVLFTSLLLPVTALSLVFSPIDANAQTPKESAYTESTFTVEKANKALGDAQKEVNRQLEAGKTNVVVKKPLNVQGDGIELGVNTKTSDESSVQAVQQKSYSGYIANTFPGAGFKHTVSGKFTYEKGKIKGNSYDVYLTGPIYSKSHSTSVSKLDPSVWEIRSSGTFKALKYTPFEYTTRVVIGLYGSGSYRVLTAKIN
ncbi:MULTISPECIES: hypothetical protein [Bacillus amyloliquefaciens group]|uniref:hypothetical protein n=1 Tax=Bacillus amyloliquefaciens group TaxID=1938374 RepID=UPI000B51B48C|nr:MULTISPECIES: hypothetical protein [Bacillus amyloliquefaciens group]ASF30715.1 hypothetical protein WV34_18910 [Bacillus amyloliquefaciens]MDQ8093278.1 hypothetical protein [Bacillus amyloliquefaciens]